MADAFPISGQIDPKTFPFLVVQLHRRAATGSLKVEGPSYHKALYFRSGRVLFGSSNDPRDQLGAILIEGGKITAEQLEDVNAKVGPGNPLAKVLSDTGFVSPRELSEAARAKVERILSDVLAYVGGTFDFEDGVLPKGAVDLKLATERLVMAAVRRVGDRNFVLRHIDGLDAILGPTAEMVPRLGDVESEAGGLPQHLDGRRTLKEAAASARLEEFEAAKIACGLLFLGLVERVKAGVTASAADAVTFADVDSGNELDLGATAAQALSPEPVMVEPAVEPQPMVTAADDDEPAPFVTGDAPSSSYPSFAAAEDSEISFVSPPFVPPGTEPRVEPEPEVHVPVAAPAPEAPPSRPVEDIKVAAVPFFAEPETVAMKSPPPAAMEPPPLAVDPPGAMSTPLPLVMPERQRSSTRLRASTPAAPSPPPAPAPPTASTRQARPSKEDLAALDGLLNSRSLEGPLTPLDKPGSSGDRGAPSFVRSGGRRAPDSRRTPMLLMMAALLLALAAGGWFYRNRLSGRLGHLAAATPTPTAPRPSLASTPPEARPVLSPSVAPAASPSAVATPAAVRPSPPVIATPRPAAVPSAAPDGRALLRAGRYPEAARAFAAQARAAGRGAAVLQLLIACSTETIQKAVDNASAPELLILPVNFKGRECYRLCWGLYPSEGKASAAVRGVPEYFRNGGASPKVLGTSEVAP